MTFHEKSAWVMGIVLILTGGWYLDKVWSMSQALGETAPPAIGLIAVATVMLVIGAVVSHIVIAAVDPENADDTEDERDQQVLRRSGNIAGYVLGFGCFAGLWHYFWQADGNLLFHIVVASLIAAQIAEHALTILFYRRGA
ncbi:MAG: hypothetical protein CMK09_18785 [Ponticaulis sp.]|nr:hypothetical protein [Ponticaulis sp.]|tara:strand:+ start:132826 stop:133248 length:423 start_codon:yes stop_codon:yes gene_type:complete